MVVVIDNVIYLVFEKFCSYWIDIFNIDIEEYCYKKIGVCYLYLVVDNDENVFFVVFWIFLMDFIGVVYVLEYIVLCGSECFFVCDLFFMMICWFLNIFMNVFISSDWIVYLFVSMNWKDFDNLLLVYLDFVFFFKLDLLDFVQEGYCLEFDILNDFNIDLVYWGVVYNEMKGVMSLFIFQLWQNLSSYLFLIIIYYYNSGGELDYIVDLSYDDLVKFYKYYYYLSNVIFVIYGNIFVYEYYEWFEELVLKCFDWLDVELLVWDEKCMFVLVCVEQGYVVNEGEGIDNKIYIVMGWLLGYSFDLQENLEGQLLLVVLLENSVLFLMWVLEIIDLGYVLLFMCGLEDFNCEMIFVCGIEGSEFE